MKRDSFLFNILRIKYDLHVFESKFDIIRDELEFISNLRLSVYKRLKQLEKITRKKEEHDTVQIRKQDLKNLQSMADKFHEDVINFSKNYCARYCPMWDLLVCGQYECPYIRDGMELIFNHEGKKS